MAITNQSRVQNRSGEILALSMNNAFEGLGWNMRRGKEEARRRKEEDARKSEERDQYQTIAEAMGMPPGAAAAAGLGQLKGFVQAGALRETAEVKQKTGEAIREFKMAMGHGAGAKASLSEILLDKGVFDPTVLGSAAKIEEAMRGGNGWNLAPGAQMDLPGGRKGVATSPNSMQVLDGSSTPLGDATVLGYIPGPDGNPSGAAIVDMGDGKRRVVNTKSGTEFPAILQATLLGAVEKQKPGWLQRILGGGGQPAAAPAAKPADRPAAPVIPMGGPATNRVPSTQVEGNDFFTEFQNTHSL